MENTYKERFSNFKKSFITECIKQISLCCSTQPFGHLHFNATDYIYMDKNDNGEYVPFVHSNNNNVEMYSMDGWSEIEDLAHWADVATDIIMACVAGCGDKYGYKNETISLKLPSLA